MLLHRNNVHRVLQIALKPFFSSFLSFCARLEVKCECSLCSLPPPPNYLMILEPFSDIFKRLCSSLCLLMANPITRLTFPLRVKLCTFKKFLHSGCQSSVQQSHCGTQPRKTISSVPDWYSELLKNSTNILKYN